MSVEYLTLGFQSGFFWQTLLQSPRAANGKEPATGPS